LYRRIFRKVGCDVTGKSKGSVKGVLTCYSGASIDPLCRCSLRRLGDQSVQQEMRNQEQCPPKRGRPIWFDPGLYKETECRWTVLQRDRGVQGDYSTIRTL